MRGSNMNTKAKPKDGRTRIIITSHEFPSIEEALASVLFDERIGGCLRWDHGVLRDREQQVKAANVGSEGSHADSVCQ